MKKRLLFLKEKDTRLIPHQEYLEFVKGGKHYIIAYRHLEGVYIYIGIEIRLRTLAKVAQKVDLHIVDRYGYILASVERRPDAHS